VALLILLSLRRGGAQTQVPPFNRDVVVLDPAHGGPDSGAHISETVDEKDVTLEFALRLRSLLQARGFTVITTRDSSNGAGLTNDRRAELANKAHAVACLVIHASSSGNGVQLGASTIGSPLASIPPPTQTALVAGAISWDRAQEVYVPQSLRLADRVGSALARSNLSLSIARVALRPLDNLTCPAISVELAPQSNTGSDPVAVSDAVYQQRAAEAIAAALIFWRNQAQQPAYIMVPKPDARLAVPNDGATATAKGSGA
jgi:N-acetylmuramoyl-L-alanine amidase